MLTGKQILAALAVKFDGNFEQMVDFISRKEDISEEEVNALNSTIKSKFVTMLDNEYPKYLTKMYRPPLVLFYYGDLSLIDDEHVEHNLSVVGSRSVSEYGKKATTSIVKDICKEYRIVSGMALGVDAIAHNVCLDNGGKTIAVLGSGIDNPYPKSNASLYRRIKENGLIISEYPNTTEPCPDHFPIRNRLVAYFSKGLLVTEASEQSGTSITVTYALGCGKEVMCIPSPLGANNHHTNHWIKEGATLVEDKDDIIDALS